LHLTYERKCNIFIKLIQVRFLTKIGTFIYVITKIWQIYVSDHFTNFSTELLICPLSHKANLLNAIKDKFYKGKINLVKTFNVENINILNST